jgi:maltose alpha-D-glucosyltransferase/alpha-amylase
LPIVDIMAQTPAIPDSAQWALFLRNHDELTLEMVTDEERLYLYRVYAHDRRARINLGIRRRLAPLLSNNRRRIELMNALLFSLPGTPIIYYGDEIGMGDNIYLGDRNGVRTPMQWSADRNAGFSRANPQQLYLPVIIDPEYHFEALNVEAQQNNPHSLLWWMKHLIDLRKDHQALGRGSIEFLHPENHRVLAFVRQWEDERILVIANLSRFSQAVELDLRMYEESVPVEMFGRTEFPPIGALPYFITMGPYGFYWFTLQAPVHRRGPGQEGVPVVRVRQSWQELLEADEAAPLEAALQHYIVGRRWFRSKARRVTGLELADVIRVGSDGATGAFVVLCRVTFLEGDPEVYVMPLAQAEGEHARDLLAHWSHTVIARVNREESDQEDRVLFDALWEPAFGTAMLDLIARRARWRGRRGEIAAIRTRKFRDFRGARTQELTPAPQRNEQSNTSLLYGDRLLLKLFRKTEPGENPELELGRFLTERTGFRCIPAVAGGLQYRTDGEEPMTLAVLNQYVPNEGDAWTYSLHALAQYYERVLTERPDLDPALGAELSPVALSASPLPSAVTLLLSAYIDKIRLLGQRTAEMHLALASDREDPAFAPEPFTSMYRRSLYQSLRSQTRLTFDLLRRQLDRLPDQLQGPARQVLSLEDRLLMQVRQVLDRKTAALRIRVHGDYHLGQVLYTGRDFVIIDFEGEPSRSIGERRFRRGALRDVAGMLRSFEYAAEFGRTHGPIRAEDQAALKPWASLWCRWVTTAFLQGYFETAEGAPFIPVDPSERSSMLNFYLLDKVVYELRYELNNRPEWIGIPLLGLLDHLGESPR